MSVTMSILLVLAFISSMLIAIPFYAYAADPVSDSTTNPAVESPAIESLTTDPAAESPAATDPTVDPTTGESFATNPTTEPSPAGSPTAESPTVTSGTEAPQVDKEALFEVIAQAQGISDVSLYTDDSQAALSAALKAAESVRDNSEVSQAQVDSATLTLTAALTGLREKPFELPAFALPALIAGGVLIVAIVVMVLVLRHRKNKKKPPGPAHNAAELPPVPRSQATNELANATSATSGQLAFGDRQHQTQDYRRQFRSGADSHHSLTIVLDEDAPTSAATDGISNMRTSDVTAVLRRLRTGESIRIGAAGATVGKDIAQATFVISNNRTISRKHARINYTNGRFYLSDLNATNGTYLNGQRLTTSDAQPLSGGDTITLSDEQFLFEITTSGCSNA
ncbi:MAG: FHA domain-containing protein [Coriobacteriales bacterium]|nr:FHA domain-containing protein [Coriobacteriales bacterium]